MPSCMILSSPAMLAPSVRLSCVAHFRIATVRDSPQATVQAPFFRFFREEGIENKEPFVRAAGIEPALRW